MIRKLSFSARRCPKLSTGFSWLLIAALALSACQSAASGQSMDNAVQQQGYDLSPNTPAPQASPTSPFPTRPRYSPGELVDYVAQTGDTLPGLAVRFNTTVPEILAANSFIPASATTMP